MDFNFPFEEFARYQEAWQREFEARDVVSLQGREVRLGDDRGPIAQILRTTFMLRQFGIANEAELAHKGKVFSAAQGFISAHVDRLFDVGLITLHDGEIAVVKSACVYTAWHLFNRTPVPLPSLVSIDKAIEMAKRL
jgi:hypothetical protein